MAVNATEKHTEILADFLLKEAATPGEQKNQSAQHPDDDEEESTVGVNPDLYDDPPDRERQKGTIDASWGEPDVSAQDGDPTAEHYSDAAYQQFIEGRQEMLGKLFASKEPAATADQKLIGQHLQHGASGEYESRAPLLEPEAMDPVKESEARQQEAASDFALSLLDD